MTHPTLFTTLISTSQLRDLQASGADVQIWDCSFDLMAPTAGPDAYAQGHIAGARYVHLDHDLSDKTHSTDKASGNGSASGERQPTGPASGGRHPTGPASGGRHPLPNRDTFATWVGHMGVTPATQVVVYDRNGCNYCGRAWWMLQWCGHANVAVLDGGWQAWQAAGGAVSMGSTNAAAGNPHNADAPKTPSPSHKSTAKYPLQPVNTAQAAIDFVASAVQKGSHTIIDARAAPRFRGEVEPLDPVAGHIPGALNRPFTLNIGPDGHFKPAAILRAEFDALLAGRDPSKVIHHCGSGVSAVPNVLAMAIAGYPPSQLFAGSWSEWSNRADLPVAQG
jgi:thiosulfate/3-mercaptopyruvate sulfurtransferase